MSLSKACLKVDPADIRQSVAATIRRGTVAGAAQYPCKATRQQTWRVL